VKLPKEFNLNRVQTKNTIAAMQPGDVVYTSKDALWVDADENVWLDGTYHVHDASEYTTKALCNVVQTLHYPLKITCDRDGMFSVSFKKLLMWAPEAPTPSKESPWRTSRQPFPVKSMSLEKAE
jgi:hypothetical protein